MRIHTIAAAAAALLLAAVLTGCSGGDPGPAPTPTTPASSSAPALSKAEVIEQCVDAVAERATEEQSGEVPFEPTPVPCEPLPESDYLDAYMDGIQQSNEAARDELDRRADEEAAKDGR